MPSLAVDLRKDVATDVTAAFSLAPGEAWLFQAAVAAHIYVGAGPAVRAQALALHPQRPLQLTVGSEPVWAWGAGRLRGLRLRIEPGPLRDRFPLAARTALERDGGFVAQASSAGEVHYRTLDGEVDRNQTVQAGDVVGVGNVPVLLRAVRDTSTAATVIGTL